MNLTFRISPVTTGFTAQYLRPDYTDLKFSLSNEDGRGLFTVNGNIVLFGEDYDFFVNTVGTVAYNIICYYNGIEFFTSNYKFISIPNRNKSFNQISLKLTAETEYISDAWKNYDKEYNINAIATETNDLYFLPGYIGLKRTSAEFFTTRLDNNTIINSNLGLSAYNIEDIDITFGVEDPIEGFYEYDGTVNYIREQATGYYLNGVKYEPDDAGGWVYISGGDVTIAGVLRPLYYRVTAGATSYTYTPAYPGEPYTYIKNANLVFNKPAINYTKVTRKVSTVIEWLCGQMGLTFSFDSTGTATDSFYSFKSMTGDSLTYGSTTSTLLYSHLLIMNLTDFIPAVDDGQNDRKAEVTMLSLKTLLDWLYTKGFHWYLENRSGTYYFKLVHYSQKTLASGNPSLNSYFNKNRLYLQNKYEIEQPEYFKIINETTCKGIDFVGTDAIFANVYGTETVKSIVDNNVFVDLNDIANRREDPYPTTENNNIVIIAAQKDGSIKDYVREAIGVLTATAQNNSELSFAYDVKNVFNDLPDSAITANFTSYTASTNRLRKRKKGSLTIPITNIKTDFDPSKYISVFGDNAEFDKLEQGAKDFTGNLTYKI